MLLAQAGSGMVVAVTADGSRQVSHDHSPGFTIQFSQEFWDDRYRSADQLWSGHWRTGE